jgi:glyoxylase-like metal-dependent hydrolase (beta-lactamase superfamily II)
MATNSGKFYVGSLELRTVSDGSSRLPPGFLFGDVSEEELRRWIPVDADGMMTLSYNSLLLRSHGKTILIDTGWGGRPLPNVPDAGHLLRNLETLGVTPETVDVVINTHAHSDHVGWNTHDHGDHVHLTFPNATYYLLDEEFEHYTRPEQVAAEPHLGYTLVPLRDSGRLELARDGTQVTPEVRIFRSPGHTAGHICVAITSGGQTAVFLGDLTHHPAQFTNPEWVLAYDVLPQTLLETRRKIMRQAVEQDLLLLTAHHVYPGVGKVSEEGGRFVWRNVGPADG